MSILRSTVRRCCLIPAVSVVHATLLLVPATVAAQSEVATAVDLSFNVGRMHSPGPQDNVGVIPALDLTASTWRPGTGSGNLTFAASLGLQGLGARDLLCRPSASGGCAAAYPTFTSVSVLAGWQTLRGRFRVLAGPTLAYEDEAALGLQGRIDLATPITRRVFISLNVRGFALPSMQGVSYQLYDFGAGLRIVQR